MLTDTGYVSDRLAGIVADADGYLIESNPVSYTHLQLVASKSSTFLTLLVHTGVGIATMR